MQFALLIYHSPEEFAMRANDYNDAHLGAWRAYYKALVEAKVYVGADALEVAETATTVRLREGKRRVQDGCPYRKVDAVRNFRFHEALKSAAVDREPEQGQRNMLCADRASTLQLRSR